MMRLPMSTPERVSDLEAQVEALRATVQGLSQAVARLEAERDKARESLLALRKKVYGEETATDIVRDEP